MTHAQGKRLYKTLFIVGTLLCSLPGYRIIDDLWNDTLGDRLEDKHERSVHDFQMSQYRQILANEGQAAAIKYQTTPKIFIRTGALRTYDSWHWLLSSLTLVAIFLLLYKIIWSIGAFAVRYVITGTNKHNKSEMATPRKPSD